MKVSSVGNVYFKASQNDVNRSKNTVSRPQINQINNITPDFNIKVPQKYTKISVDKINNELEVHNYKLANGYKVSIIPMEGSPSVVKTFVNVGSMNETKDIKGISHFLEHMAFNGTNGENGHIKLETGDSFKKIDEIGGWANASTNYAITDYVNSSHLLEDKDLETQIKVISAMAEDLKLSEEMIKKEKGPVCSEINMIMDNPQTVAMDQTVRTLFNIKNPADEMVGGSVRHIQNLTRKDVMDYYNKYYTPDNTNIVISGDVNPDEVIELVAKNFTSTKRFNSKRFDEKLSPIKTSVRKDFISDKTNSSEIILGFTGPKNNEVKEKILLDLAIEYLTSYNSGLEKNLKKYNTGVFIDYEKISSNPNSPVFTYMGLTTSDKNTEKVLKTIFETVQNHEPVSEEILENLKDKRITSRENALEYSESVNTMVGNAVLNGTPESVTKYNDILKSITVEELNNAINKYFDLSKTAITVIHPSEKSEISFKGKIRKPIDENKIEEVNLDNNFKVALYNTKSNNINFLVDLRTKPFDRIPGVSAVLDEIYGMGTSDMTEEEFKLFKEKNNLDIFAGCSSDGIFGASMRNKNPELGVSTLQKLIYNPRIDEETLSKAKNSIKDRLARMQDTAGILYFNYDAERNPYACSDSEILANIDKITVDDVKNFHKQLLERTSGTVRANIPNGDTNVREFVLNAVKSMPVTQIHDNEKTIVYKPDEKTVLLTKANKNSQADISQIYRYKISDTIKEDATAELMNSILSGSSIGLFDVLREKQHLAYAVHSYLNRIGDRGEVVLNILTTTDNKDIGEISYDNVQKSLDGFQNQINELIAGNFTDKDLENEKRRLKAILLENESANAKLHSLTINSKHGLMRNNLVYNEIDNITKEDITEFAKKVFANKPVTAIVASQDTLDANKEYLKKFE